MGAFHSAQRPHAAVRAAADPRSPTTAFARTPLGALPPLHAWRTSAAHDPRSPTAGLRRTPLAAQLAVTDPRSPTAGVARTPLARLATAFAADPRSPTHAFVRTPLPAEPAPLRRRPVRRRLALDAAPSAGVLLDDTPTEVFDPVPFGAPLDAQWAIVDAPFVQLYATDYDDELFESAADGDVDAAAADDDDELFESVADVVDDAADELCASAVDAAELADALADAEPRTPVKARSPPRTPIKASTPTTLMFRTPLAKLRGSASGKLSPLGAPRTPQAELRRHVAIMTSHSSRHALSCPSSPAA